MMPAPTTQTLPSRPITVTLAETPSQTIAAALTRPDSPIDCLTQAIYYEARSESEEGQAAVAEVILNRARSGRYPAGVCDVVYQRNSRTCQFSYTCDGSIGRTRINAQSWARAERIARDVFAGRSTALLPARSVNYHANYVSPGWGRRLERVRQIGAHIFYGAPLEGRTPGASADGAEQTPSQSRLVFARLGALDNAYVQFQASLQSTAADTAPQASAAVPD
jgi:spore germination cell wall hydrolase CwlJ-like protein